MEVIEVAASKGANQQLHAYKHVVAILKNFAELNPKYFNI